MESTVDLARWTERAVAEAEDLVDLDDGARHGLGCGVERVRSAGLAGLAPAHADLVRRRGSGAQVVVEADDPVDVGSAEEQDVGDDRHIIGVDVAELGLDGVQDFQKWSRLIHAGLGDRADPISPLDVTRCGQGRATGVVRGSHGRPLDGEGVRRPSLRLGCFRRGALDPGLLRVALSVAQNATRRA